MSQLTQHPFDPEEVMSYLDGELDLPRAAALAGHLVHCGDCQTLATELRRISERLLDFEVESSPAVIEKDVMAALEAGDPESKQVRGDAIKTEPRVWKRLLASRYAWAAACVLILAVVGATVFRTRLASPVFDHASLLGSPNGGRAATYLYDTGKAQSAQQAIAQRREEAAQSESLESSSPVPPPPPSGDTLAAPQPAGPMIAQTASLVIVPANYDEASGAIDRLAAGVGGYVQKMTAEAQIGAPRELSATLRVPANQLAGFLAELRKLGHVEEEHRANDEVTDQYVDLEARLKSARASEQRMLELLATRTGKLADVLDAERELARIREEIESMEGQRVLLAHRVSYATVDVQLKEEYRERLNSESSSTKTKIWNAAIEGFANLEEGVVSILLFLLEYGLSILFWLAVLVIPGWFIWMRFRSRNSLGS
jgi:anti-sigma factor RsiW